jgi:hypothetical protein
MCIISLNASSVYIYTYHCNANQWHTHSSEFENKILPRVLLNTKLSDIQNKVIVMKCMLRLTAIIL